MRTYTYRGKFVAADNGHTYYLEVDCNGFLQAFFLLTAAAIQSGQHYQLYSITDTDNGNIRYVDDIVKCSKLLTQ